MQNHQTSWAQIETLSLGLHLEELLIDDHSKELQVSLLSEASRVKGRRTLGFPSQTWASKLLGNKMPISRSSSTNAKWKQQGSMTSSTHKRSFQRQIESSRNFSLRSELLIETLSTKLRWNLILIKPKRKQARPSSVLLQRGQSTIGRRWKHCRATSSRDVQSLELITRRAPMVLSLRS